MEVLRGEQDDLVASAGIDIIIDIEQKSPSLRRSEGHIVSDYDILLCETLLEMLTDSSQEVS